MYVCVRVFVHVCLCVYVARAPTAAGPVPPLHSVVYCALVYMFYVLSFIRFIILLLVSKYSHLSFDTTNSQLELDGQSHRVRAEGRECVFAV